MVIESNLERDCHLLGNVFASLIGELKNSNGAWEDLLSKASKLQSAIKNSCSALSGFLDALQRIADMATNTKGATREIGSSLTRLCLRHRTLEQRLKDLSNKMQDHFIAPMQSSSDDWRRVAFAIDKDHTREIKRARQDLKRLTNEALKAQKKAKKGNIEAQYHLDQLFQELSDRYAVLESLQRTALRVAMREERARYCYFIRCLQPMMEEEIAILDERNNVREILDLLSGQSIDPDSLPEASEQAIRDMQGHQVRVWEVLRTKVASGHFENDLAGSDGGSLSRKSSSLCSIDDDDGVSNDDSDDENGQSASVKGSTSNGAHKSGAIQHGVISNTTSRSKVHRKLSEVLTSSTRMSSVAASPAIGGSYDSGFMSQAEHYGPVSGASLVYSSATSATTASADGSGGSPESEPGIMLSAKSQMMMMNTSSSTMRPHTISQAYHAQQQRPSLSQGMFEPPQQNEQLYGTANDANAATLMRLSKPVPPPRIPIRLNALDQPSNPVSLSGDTSVNGCDSVSLNGDYAPIYANANELSLPVQQNGSISGGGSISSASGFSQQQYLQLAIQQQQLQQQQQQQQKQPQQNGTSRRQRSASTSSNDHYLELQPIGNGGRHQHRTRTPQPTYATHQQFLAMHKDDQSLSLAMRQLECSVAQMTKNDQQEFEQQQIIQASDGLIYAPVSMIDSGTIRRAPQPNGSVKPTPPTRRASTEVLSVMHPNGRPPNGHHPNQQPIFQPAPLLCNRSNQPQQVPPPPPMNGQNVHTPQQQKRNQQPAPGTSIAAIVDHAMISAQQNGPSQQNSPLNNTKSANRSGQNGISFQQQLTQAITQRQSSTPRIHSAQSTPLQQRHPIGDPNSCHSSPLHQTSQNSRSRITNNPPPPPLPCENNIHQQPPDEDSFSSHSSSPTEGNHLLAALQSKRQQLRKTIPNDRSAPKVASR